MICIVDYGSGNVSALMNVFKRRRIKHFVSGEPSRLSEADRFLLPGVGAFDPTMRQLRDSGILDALSEEVMGKGKRVLGICVGMHLLAERSEEGELPGLGWIPGTVRKIDTSALTGPPYLPHMGWNGVEPVAETGLFNGVSRERGFYFLHSYFFDATRENDIAARVDYGGLFPCAVEHENVAGVQFHPEKCHTNGVTLLQNFAELA